MLGGVPGTLTVREHVHLFTSYYPRALSTAEALERAGLIGNRVVWYTGKTRIVKLLV